MIRKGQQGLLSAGIVILVLISGYSGFGQNTRAEAQLDTTRIYIGDQVNLWLRLEQPAGQRILFPVTGDSLTGKLEVLSVSPIDTMGLKEKIWHLRQRIVITSFDTGFFIIPSMVFRVDGRADSIITRALPLEVLAIQVDTTKGITDIKLPYEVPLTFWEVAPYLIIGFLLLAILFFYLRYLKKRKKKEEPSEKPDVPHVPAHIAALEQLDALMREKLWQQGKVKLFYSRLTDIIRQYIELRYAVPAMEQTTEEILAAFEKSALINEPVRQELKVMLELADLVKFAKWHPVAGEHEASQQAAYDFILRTKPVVNLRKPLEEVKINAEKEG